MSRPGARSHEVEGGAPTRARIDEVFDWVEGALSRDEDEPGAQPQQPIQPVTLLQQGHEEVGQRLVVVGVWLWSGSSAYGSRVWHTVQKFKRHAAVAGGRVVKSHRMA